MITDKLTQAIAEAYKKMKEELVGGQKKLDVNKNKRIDSQDLAILRAKNEELEEGHPANLEAIKNAAKKPHSPNQRLIDRNNRLFKNTYDDAKERNKRERDEPPFENPTPARDYTPQKGQKTPAEYSHVKGLVKGMLNKEENDLDEEFMSEGYAVQGVRKHKPHLPGWLNVTRHVNGNISSLDLSRGKPPKIFDNEEEAKAHVAEIGAHLSKQRGHGWGPLTVQKVRGKATTNEEFESLDEKAVSQAQQRFMGMVHATQKGDMEAPSPEVAKVAGSMTKKAAKDYASTKLAGLPKHVGEEKEEQKPKLPPHLIKLLRDKGLLDSQLNAKKHTIRDVTPKGYGPNEETELDEATDDEFHKKWWRKRDRKRSAAQINTPNLSKAQSDERTEKLKIATANMKKRYGAQKEETELDETSRVTKYLKDKHAVGVGARKSQYQGPSHELNRIASLQKGREILKGKQANEEVEDIEEGKKSPWDKLNARLKSHGYDADEVMKRPAPEEKKKDDDSSKKEKTNEELSREASVVKEVYNKAKAEASAKDARRGGPQTSKKRETFDSEPEMDILPVASERSGKKKL